MNPIRANSRFWMLGLVLAPLSACSDSAASEDDRSAEALPEASVPVDAGSVRPRQLDAGHPDARVADATVQDPCARCEGITCPRPQDWCSDDVAYTYSGAGFCDPRTGNCVFTDVEHQIRCAVSTCIQGRCIDDEDGGTGSHGCHDEAPRRWELGDPLPTCSPPAPRCDGEVAVTSSGFSSNWWCNDTTDGAVCEFTEKTQNCSLLTGFHCKDGRCVQCESDADCGAIEKCASDGRCVPACPSSR